MQEKGACLLEGGLFKPDLDVLVEVPRCDAKDNAVEIFSLINGLGWHMLCEDCARSLSMTKYSVEGAFRSTIGAPARPSFPVPPLCSLLAHPSLLPLAPASAPPPPSSPPHS